jgi:hypothetical protein
MPQDIVNEVRQYVSVQDQIKLLTDRKNKLRDELLAVVTELGQEDGLKGHLFYEVNDGVSGISGIQKQKNVGNSYDEDAAERILKDKGLWEKCTKMVRVPVEDEIRAARFTEQLSDEDIDAIFPPTISYKLVIKK